MADGRSCPPQLLPIIPPVVPPVPPVRLPAPPA